MQHNQEATDFSTTETIVPDRKAGAVYTEPESSIGELSPLRTSTKAKREKTYEPLSSTLPVIPPTHTNRTLVLCFDGTGDEFDGDNSNVVQLCALLKKDEPDKQMVYYQSGIGTVSAQQYITPLASTISKTLDQMVAYSLDTQVMEGYQFLMQSYSRGDRICMFGFSRGAYTARALAGMLHKVGLLPPNNHNQVPFAYKLFTDTTPFGWDQSNAFKRSFSIDVEVEFVGVWDTVNSVGIIPRRLPFTTSNTVVKTFRHALALDEHRAKFQPNVWNRPNELEAQLGSGAGKPVPKTPPPTRKSSPNQTLRSRISRVAMRSPVTAEPEPESSKSDTRDDAPWFSVGKHKTTRGSNKRWGTDEDEVKLSNFERVYSERHTKPTDIKEVWFAGCHCDVGGGSVPNYEPHSLARIPLRWMIRECFLTETGIMFDAEGLRDVGLDPSSLWPLVLPRPLAISPAQYQLPAERLPDTSLHRRFASLFSRKPSKWLQERLSLESETLEEALGTRHEHGALGELREGTEEEEELFDALSPVYDQLKLRKFWWMLELFPVELKHQRSDDTWVSRMVLNRGRPRKIMDQKENGINVHRSVKMRMEAPFCIDTDGNVVPKRYKPKARFKVEPTWVD